jgi:hypothetical protein
MRLDGRCHCGNVEVTFETARAPAELQLRECGCGFCRRHGSTAATDPAGRVEFRIRDPAEVSRYQFALRTAEFLVCRTCGVFVGAVCTMDGSAYATLNVNVLEARASLTSRPVPVDYDGESAADRVARRRARWTPATVRDGGH